MDNIAMYTPILWETFLKLGASANLLDVYLMESLPLNVPGLQALAGVILYVDNVILILGGNIPRTIMEVSGD